MTHERKDFITLLLMTKRVTVTWKIPNVLIISHLLILKPLLNSISISIGRTHFKAIFVVRNSILKVQLFSVLRFENRVAKALERLWKVCYNEHPRGRGGELLLGAEIG